MTMAMTPMLLASLFYPAVMVHAGLRDLATMKIPNRLVLVLLLGYVVLAPLSGLTLGDIALSIAVAAVVFMAAFAAFACRWMGGGDVKLITVAALWLGAGSVPAFLLGTALLGALLTAIVLGYRAMPLPASWREVEWLRRLHAWETGIPYGVAIAAAGILTFRGTPWMSAWW